MKSQKARHMKAKANLFGFLLIAATGQIIYADGSVEEIDQEDYEINIKVIAEITEGCVIGSGTSNDYGDIGGIEFEPIRSAEGGITSTKRANFVAANSFQLTCTPNTEVVMSFGAGESFSGNSRRLKNAGNNYMPYDLVHLKNGQRIVIQANNGKINVPIGKDGKFKLDIEGVMYMHMMPSPIPTGIYEDTVQVTFSY